MRRNTVKTTNVKIDIEPLEADLKGNILLSYNTNFEEYIVVYNAAIIQRPLIIVLPEDNDDITKTLLCEKKHQLPLSVRGGGHDWAGRSLVQNVSSLI